MFELLLELAGIALILLLVLVVAAWRQANRKPESGEDRPPEEP